MLNYDGRLDDEPVVDNKGLSVEELNTLSHILNFWNSFIKLENNNQENVDIVRNCVNQINNAVAFRVAKRNNPEIWK